MVGLDRTILRTSNGGLTWKRDSTDLATAGFYDIAFSDTLNGWAAGLNGLARTTDGGRTWQQSSIITDPVFTLTFTDARHGWLCGYDVVQITRDGGETWFSGDATITDLRQLEFQDSLYGMALGSDHLPYWTGDGGLTWLPRPLSDRLTRVNGLTLGAAQQAWAAGDYGVCLRTTNSGQTWQSNRSPIREFYQASFADAAHGWAACSGQALLRTSNGGASWSDSSLTSPWQLFAVRFTDAQAGWATGCNTADCVESHALLRSLNGGLNWTPVFETTDSLVTSFAAPDADCCWLVTQPTVSSGAVGYTCWRTINGGQTWQAVATAQADILSLGGCLDAQTAWLEGLSMLVDTTVARCRTFARTTDGGNTWQRTYSDCCGQTEVPPRPLKSGFFNATEGWACFAGIAMGECIFARTRDGGAHFESMGSLPSYTLADMAFPDPAHGWGVGPGGMLYATEDSGRTWLPCNSGTTESLQQVQFAGGDGWITARGGLLHLSGSSPVSPPLRLRPVSFSLAAFPNPFNPTTTLRFTLPQAGRVTLRIYDLLGREVTTLLDAPRAAGSYALPFDGSHLATGLYFARIENASASQVQKLLLVK